MVDSNEGTSNPELDKQNARFGYKAPESVYVKPKETMVDRKQAFQGVSPMDFYSRQNAAKKAEKQKERETKTGQYKNDMGKAFF
jgi:hypothetical protein